MEHFSDILLNEGIVARDSSMVKLYSDALSIAPTDANILIVGASGTGKDCLAKFIHRHSPRAGAPFIHINCSAIPAELFESEFFGYESGAFTGSSASGRQGLIAQAAGGTLFLDEIGELDLDLQTKLLQVVQEHSMRSIGSTEYTSVNIRIIAATNRSLPGMIKAGQFRLDLYYRLNVVSFDIPPLSRRRQDIRIPFPAVRTGLRLPEDIYPGSHGLPAGPGVAGQYSGDTEFHGEALCPGGCVRHNRHASERELPFFPQPCPPDIPGSGIQALKTGGCRVPKNIYHGSPAAYAGCG